jgi:gamma-glutamyltranspeptidase/glutathione hydrolase
VSAATQLNADSGTKGRPPVRLSACPTVRLFSLVSIFWCTSCIADRPAPDGNVGVVAAASPEAAQAGIEILEAGGNAIDAAVAISFALGVTEPAMSGLGGQSQILLQRPGEPAVVISGTSYAPAGTPAEATSGDLTAHRATTVPSTVRVLDHAWRNHGSGRIEWAQLLAPAIGYAEDGFSVGRFRHLVWQRHGDDLAADSVTRRLFLTSDGGVPGEGEMFRQPVLAATLRRLAEHGADDFYQGQIADGIAGDMAANGGWITRDDLTNFPQPEELAPLRGAYRDMEVATLPPPGGGWVVLQILNVLEQTTAHELQAGTPSRVLRLAEALRVGHKERRDDPVTDLVDYDEHVRPKIDKATAIQLLRDERQGRGETTHFSVADGDGMVVVVTASINAYFGARAASPGLGFLYNDYMHEFEVGDPDHPFALRANAMPYSSMSPTILSRDGVPVLGLGSPGSARIISAVAQVTQLWSDTDIGIEAAVAAPRVHVVPNEAVYLEAQPGASVLDSLSAYGFQLEEPSADLMIEGRNAYFGGVHAVALERGVWTGAADPRRDGVVIRRTVGARLKL